MDYPKDSMFTYLFSTYKKTAGIVFVAILLVAVPISLTLLSQPQDIRQRASPPVYQACTTDNDCLQGYACMGVGDDSTRSECRPSEDREPRSCSTDEDCNTGTSCQVVGQTNSIPPSDIKQCVANTNLNTPSTISDLNDDGVVNRLDLNILYSGFANREGD